MSYINLSECMQRLKINNRQLTRLLEAADIDATTSQTDKRIKLITEEQFHELQQSYINQTVKSSNTPLDLRVNTLEMEIRRLRERLATVERRLAPMTTNHPQNYPEPQTFHNENNDKPQGISLLPDGYIALSEFATQNNIPQTTLKKAVESGRLACHHNPEGWKHHRTYVKWAFDSDQITAAQAMYSH